MSPARQYLPPNVINERTWIPLGAAGVIVAFIVGATWKISDELHKIQETVRDVSSYRWTMLDQRDYVEQMRQLNAAVSRSDGKSGLLIPDPMEIRRRTVQSQANTQ